MENHLVPRWPPAGRHTPQERVRGRCTQSHPWSQRSKGQGTAELPVDMFCRGVRAYRSVLTCCSCIFWVLSPTIQIFSFSQPLSTLAGLQAQEKPLCDASSGVWGMSLTTVAHL